MSWDDLAAVANEACRDTFGVSATYTPAVGSPVTINVIHDAPGSTVSLNGLVPVQTTNHTVDVVVADVGQDPAQGDTLTIGAVTYEVLQVEPDGNGMCRLYLMVT